MTPEEIVGDHHRLGAGHTRTYGALQGRMAADVQSIITKYKVDQAVFSAAIAAAKASGK